MKKGARIASIVLASVALLNSIVVPICYDEEFNFINVVSELVDNDYLFRLSGTQLMLWIFIASVVLFIASLCNSRTLCITASTSGMISWIGELIDYGDIEDALEDFLFVGAAIAFLLFLAIFIVSVAGKASANGTSPAGNYASDSYSGAYNGYNNNYGSNYNSNTYTADNGYASNSPYTAPYSEPNAYAGQGSYADTYAYEDTRARAPMSEPVAAPVSEPISAPVMDAVNESMVETVCVSSNEPVSFCGVRDQVMDTIVDTVSENDPTMILGGGTPDIFEDAPTMVIGDDSPTVTIEDSPTMNFSDMRQAKEVSPIGTVRPEDAVSNTPAFVGNDSPTVSVNSAPLFCTRCGTRLEVGAAFCCGCGFRVADM